MEKFADVLVATAMIAISIGVLVVWHVLDGETTPIASPMLQAPTDSDQSAIPWQPHPRRD
jgi:hypothetical protein